MLQLRRARAAGIWCFLFPLDTASCTEVRALEAQLSALKSSTPAVLAPATPAPMAVAATAAPATAAHRKYANEGSAVKAGSGREGRNRAKTPVREGA